MVQRIESDNEDEEYSAPLHSVDRNVSEQENAVEETVKGSPHGRKRARLSSDGRAVKRESMAYRDEERGSHASGSRPRLHGRDGDASGQDVGDESVDVADDENHPAPRLQTQPRDSDGHVSPH